MTWFLAAPLASATATHTVHVCVDGWIGHAKTLNQAMRVTDEIYKQIGVQLRWQCSKSAGVRTLHMGFEEGGKGGFRDAALAYALPYEGSTIRIRHDSVHRYPEGQRGGVLGYIMAHEIGHLLQGIERHSEEGLMKARWDDEDRHRIFVRKLPFARLDVDLIHLGLAKSRRAGEFELTKP